ncbi:MULTISPECIES: Hcp family type VI secretion system effector [Lelliottia]|uniref:Type VI secretion system tube protein TssD n=1 Tax=Lelliottia wanjuensis TaxID=3050585 RepID=A0AAP4CZ94_9ENTR|nr:MULTISPECIES: type VI secretion system tube protein TssD [unclassified Lelliottia]MDK9357378.1 type VI secretion system tube protein TssD [Lelliottia sp. V106_16]MDK9362251.1 type VI secretion system tube protein TssD [Lelliottia sp. V106_12]MDK9373130.1 type VI secretion system tube protein TssD [Lelliottia sp. V106_10]MDK9586550.1 type VI secretion system tube protein TssD [Lelliottia sp. V86_10]MDK9599934.1 type VI secretion system tube protein TssD [Lelliottia sp. V106_5]
MSLPAYMFLYDENGMLVDGGCKALGREGAIEVMSSSYGVYQNVDSHTGSMTGTRQHSPFVIHKQIDKASPYLAVCVCESRRLQKAEIRYYDINEAGIEREVYRITLESVVVMGVSANHTYIPGSNSPNMLETVSLRSRGIEWHYIEGVIKYGDSWMKKEEKK